MTTCNFAASILTASALLPLLAHASVETKSAAACAQAMASTMAASSTEVPKYRFRYVEDSSPSAMSYFYGQALTFDVQAKDPKSGVTIARATCEIGRDGNVAKLSALPLKAPATTLASAF
jgi:hypothetical protein